MPTDRIGCVRDWMSRQPLFVSPETEIGSVARRMRAAGIRHALVLDGEGLAGIVSDRDLRGLLLEEASGLTPATPVARVMAESPVTVDVDAPLADAARAMLEGRIGALPVMQAGRPVGILTRSDALEALLAALEGGA